MHITLYFGNAKADRFFSNLSAFFFRAFRVFRSYSSSCITQMPVELR